MSEYVLEFMRKDVKITSFIIPKNSIDPEVLSDFDNEIEFIEHLIPMFICAVNRAIENNEIKADDHILIKDVGFIQITQDMIDQSSKFEDKITETGEHELQEINSDGFDESTSKFLEKVTELLNEGDEDSILDFFKFVKPDIREMIFKTIKPQRMPGISDKEWNEIQNDAKQLIVKINQIPYDNSLEKNIGDN